MVIGEPMAIEEPLAIEEPVTIGGANGHRGALAREEPVPYLYIYLQQPLSYWGADSVRPRNALKQASALWT